MEGMYRFESINDNNLLSIHKTLHPLVNVLDMSLANPRDWDGNKKVQLYFGFYCVFLKEFKGCDLRYDRTNKNPVSHYKPICYFIFPKR